MVNKWWTFWTVILVIVSQAITNIVRALNSDTINEVQVAELHRIIVEQAKEKENLFREARTSQGKANLLEIQIANLQEELTVWRRMGEDKAEQARRYREKKDREQQRARQRQGNPFGGTSFNYEDLNRASEGLFRNSYNFGEASFDSQAKVTLADIKKAYRAKVKEIHPDLVRAKGGTQAEIDKATAELQVVNAQYAKDKERYTQ